jgi:GNAT superfamily N-acetyltransferase
MREATQSNASAIAVRRLRREDAEAVRELDSLILGKDRSSTWAEYVDRFLAFSKLGTLALPWSGSQVAEKGDAVVGFLLAERQSSGYGMPPGVRVVAIAVHPEYRNHGIGRQLVEALKADCKRQGIKNVYSVLQDRDERDADFLMACGFKPAPVRVFSLDA